METKATQPPKKRTLPLDQIPLSPERPNKVYVIDNAPRTPPPLTGSPKRVSPPPQRNIPAMIEPLITSDNIFESTKILFEELITREKTIRMKEGELKLHRTVEDMAAQHINYINQCKRTLNELPPYYAKPYSDFLAKMLLEISEHTKKHRESYSKIEEELNKLRKAPQAINQQSFYEICKKINSMDNV
jgi:hypothetical protein